MNEPESMMDSPAANSNGRALLAFAIVPYLGVLFLLPALVCIIVEPAPRRRTFAATAAVAIAQGILWWALYVIPEIGARV